MRNALKALLKQGRNLPVEEALPTLRRRFIGFRVQTPQLVAYRRLFHFPEDGAVPIPFLFVMLQTPHLELLTDRRFPLRLLGLIHKSSTFRQHQRLAVDRPYTLEVILGGGRLVRAGRAFDLHATFSNTEGLCADVTSTLVARAVTRINKKSGEEKALVRTDKPLAKLDYPRSAGWRYAQVSHDYNPIHIHRWLARLWGFPAAVIHGMYSAAKIYRLLAPTLSPPHCFHVDFLKPIFMPATALLHAQTKSDEQRFTLWSNDGQTPHVTGTLESRPMAPAETLPQ